VIGIGDMQTPILRKTQIRHDKDWAFAIAPANESEATMLDLMNLLRSGRGSAPLAAAPQTQSISATTTGSILGVAARRRCTIQVIIIDGRVIRGGIFSKRLSWRRSQGFAADAAVSKIANAFAAQDLTSRFSH
jgi:hypothetical protein